MEIVTILGAEKAYIFPYKTHMPYTSQRPLEDRRTGPDTWRWLVTDLAPPHSCARCPIASAGGKQVSEHAQKSSHLFPMSHLTTPCKYATSKQGSNTPTNSPFPTAPPLLESLSPPRLPFPNARPLPLAPDLPRHMPPHNPLFPQRGLLPQLAHIHLARLGLVHEASAVREGVALGRGGAQ